MFVSAADLDMTYVSPVAAILSRGSTGEQDRVLPVPAHLRQENPLIDVSGGCRRLLDRFTDQVNGDLMCFLHVR